MKIAVFSSKPHDHLFLSAANTEKHQLHFLEPRLTVATAGLTAGFEGVCVFVHDEVSPPVLKILAENGCRLVALRCAGFNNVDLVTAQSLGITVARVPSYSPASVAEFAVGLLLTLNRKFHRSYNRVREGNFSLDGLLGFDLEGKTVGVLGTGKIGQVFVRIMKGFGCQVLAHDPYEVEEVKQLGAHYVSLETVFARSDIISLHCPLSPATHHLICEETIRQLKSGVILLNTSRGALIDSAAAIDGIKSGKIGALGLDVYEEESGLFYENLSGKIIDDDVLMRLLTFPNVLVTSHQAFFTQEALDNIARTTLENITEFTRSGTCPNCIK
jgi:D-lactate dehydrogenase